MSASQQELTSTLNNAKRKRLECKKCFLPSVLRSEIFSYLHQPGDRDKRDALHKELIHFVMLRNRFKRYRNYNSILKEAPKVFPRFLRRRAWRDVGGGKWHGLCIFVGHVGEYEDQYFYNEKFVKYTVLRVAIGHHWEITPEHERLRYLRDGICRRENKRRRNNVYLVS